MTTMTIEEKLGALDLIKERAVLSCTDLGWDAPLAYYVAFYLDGKRYFDGPFTAAAADAVSKALATYPGVSDVELRYNP